MARLKRLSIGGGFACLVIPAVVALLSPAILSAWISPGFSAENRGLVLWLFASAAVLSFAIPAYYLLIGLGEIRAVGVQAVVGGVLGLSTALVFSGAGIGAFAAGRMVFALVGLWLILWLWRVARHQRWNATRAGAPENPSTPS
jgi:O-antigen/teichoic acid export membrane protein